METIEIVRLETAPTTDIEEMLEGHVFHVTKYNYWKAILKAGRLEPNTNNTFPTTFGFSQNSFFRKLGYISVFDYRIPPTEKIKDYRSRCYPLQAAIPGTEGIMIMIFNPSIYDVLIPWTKWEEQGDQKQMVVPYGEAGHPGPISIDKIDKLIHVRFEEEPYSYVATLRNYSKIQALAGCLVQ